MLIYRPEGTNYAFELHFRKAGSGLRWKNIALSHKLDSTCDYICCSTPDELEREIRLYGNIFNYLLWCDEPVWLTIQNRNIREFSSYVEWYYGIRIKVLTHQNGGLDWSWKTFLTDEYIKEINYQTYSHRTKECIFIGAKRMEKCFANRSGDEVPLSLLRSKLALYFWHHNVCDVIGQGWNPPYSERKSCREADNWPERKDQLLRDYMMNICIENTMIKGYVTEKIWQSINAGCLPIYYFGNIEEHPVELRCILKTLQSICIDVTNKSYSTVIELIQSISSNELQDRVASAKDVLVMAHMSRMSVYDIANAIVGQLNEVL